MPERNFGSSVVMCIPGFTERHSLDAYIIPALSEIKMKNKYPKISILTPSYNSGKYIERAIQSVLQQDYNNWEHIIIDGGSTDETLEILKKYPHLKWISEPDKGQSDAMNKAFEMSRGDIIGYLNADDYYQANVFMGVANRIKLSNIEVLVGGLVVNSRGVKNEAFPATTLKEILTFDDWKFPVNPVSYFYKRDVQLKIGVFPLDLHYAMDYWFLLRAYSNFNVELHKDVLGTFDLNDSSKTSNYNQSILELLMILLSFLKENKNFSQLLPSEKIKYYNLKLAELLIKTRSNLRIRIRALASFCLAYPIAVKSQLYLLKKIWNG